MIAHSRARIALGVAALVASVTFAPDAVGSTRQGRTYVALGDSYASAPLVPVQYEEPWGCLRSSSNYAHQVAKALGVSLRDVTCSGAQTDDMWESQGTSPEEELGRPTNPPQLDALGKRTKIVTLQIGGNDIGFVDLALTCARGEVDQTGCTEAVAAKQPFREIKRTIPKISRVLEEIHRRSPDASIYVLGYPGIFKIGATASCPAMAAMEDDAKYLRSIHEALNTMIRRVAEDAANATYVDIYAPSAGHTACDLPVLRWVEPIVPVNLAAPVHPNLGGMNAIRDLLLKVITPGTDPGGLPAPPDSPL